MIGESTFFDSVSRQLNRKILWSMRFAVAGFDDVNKDGNHANYCGTGVS